MFWTAGSNSDTCACCGLVVQQVGQLGAWVACFIDALQLCCRASMARCVVCRLSVCPSVCHGCIVAKRCEIRPIGCYRSLTGSRIGFQMTWKSLTLDDLEGLGYNALWYADRALLWLNGKSSGVGDGRRWRLPIGCQ